MRSGRSRLSRISSFPLPEAPLGRSSRVSLAENALGSRSPTKIPRSLFPPAAAPSQATTRHSFQIISKSILASIKQSLLLVKAIPREYFSGIG